MNSIMKKNTLFTLIFFSFALIGFTGCSEDSSMASGHSDAGGKGGSMARFTISGNHLYTVDTHSLKLFELTDAQHPKYLNGKDQAMDSGVETIFTLDTLLFIGAQDGMYIYDIKRPEFPNLLSKTLHVRSCDPVVASGNYAYVTLNTEDTWCGSFTNMLDIYDISNPQNPNLKKSLPLSFPKGLGVDGNKLFVCERTAGIKMFDISDPINPVWTGDLAHIPEMQNLNTYDVIPLNGILLVSATGGFYQLDYTGEDLKFLSKIEVKGEKL